MLKKIGTAARLQIEKMLEQRVFLELFVKVRPEWRESHSLSRNSTGGVQLEHLARPGKLRARQSLLLDCSGVL